MSRLYPFNQDHLPPTAGPAHLARLAAVHGLILGRNQGLMAVLHGHTAHHRTGVAGCPAEEATGAEAAPGARARGWRHSAIPVGVSVLGQPAGGAQDRKSTR